MVAGASISSLGVGAIVVGGSLDPGFDGDSDGSDGDDSDGDGRTSPGRGSRGQVSSTTSTVSTSSIPFTPSASSDCDVVMAIESSGALSDPDVNESFDAHATPDPRPLTKKHVVTRTETPPSQNRRTPRGARGNRTRCFMALRCWSGRSRRAPRLSVGREGPTTNRMSSLRRTRPCEGHVLLSDDKTMRGSSEARAGATPGSADCAQRSGSTLKWNLRLGPMARSAPLARPLSRGSPPSRLRTWPELRRDIAHDVGEPGHIHVIEPGVPVGAARTGVNLTSAELRHIAFARADLTVARLGNASVNSRTCCVCCSRCRPACSLEPGRPGPALKSANPRTVPRAST